MECAWTQPPLTEHRVSSIRFGHRHAIEKVEHRLESEPVLSSVLLQSGLYWLVQHYFVVRGRPYLGEKAALVYLKQHEPELWAGIEQFYGASLPEQLALYKALGEKMLEPVGGLWKKGEILALGDSESTNQLQIQGRRLFSRLLGENDREPQNP